MEWLTAGKKLLSSLEILLRFLQVKNEWAIQSAIHVTTVLQRNRLSARQLVKVMDAEGGAGSS